MKRRTEPAVHAVRDPAERRLFVDDGQVDLSWRLQAWTGATIGLFAVKNGATTENYADFDSFTVTNQD